MISSLAIVAFAALIHASFQLSVSMLTLLSGHAIGAKTAHSKLLRLTNGFLLGVAVMTMLVISFIAFFFQHVFGTTVPLIAWAIACGLLLGLGVAVWAFYYRREQGTSLWLPRGVARYLSERTMIISALILIRLEPIWQLAGVGIYTVISLLSLLIICGLIGSGHKLSRIQKWREDNKRFLQFSAGSGLLILGFYVYVDQVVSVTAFAFGGH
jgi:hypothetical protein